MANPNKKVDTKKKVISKNKKAFHDYEILETFEAGLVLTGTEVRSLRDSSGQLTDTFIHVKGGEAHIVGMHIKPYIHGSYSNVDPDRRRKLLLHKKQIRYLKEQIKIKGLTVVPIKLYFDDNNRVKIEIAVAKGKKLYDKRHDLAKRDAQRDIERSFGARR